MTSVTKTWAFFLVVVTTVLATGAQFFLKSGVAALPAQMTLSAVITDIPLLFGVFLYGLGAFIMVLALKGGDVSGLYPVVSTSFVWVALLAHFLLGEAVHWLRWTGIIIIIAGIFVIGYAGRHPEAA
jgi:undecaprenyl phosphate-alpha-L-ara4N flippase subunit ArnE